MTDLPRILVLIGSGETAPLMTRGHRMLVGRIRERLGRRAAIPAAVIDSTYGFQENAAALSEGLIGYFNDRVGLSTSLASLRPGQSASADAAAWVTLRSAAFIFSGPGSPSYALRCWSGTQLATILADKLRHGGVIAFASAAALTLGRVSVPVYEVYKAGAEPYWLPGLDVLGEVGISAAVVPHYDNREGSGHDTRYCFLGERRLQVLEQLLPESTYVLGIDEHTALLLDFEADRAIVHGRGGVTIREHGVETVLRAGSDLPLAELRRVTPALPRVAASVPDPDAPAARLAELERLALERARAAQLVEPLVEALLELRRAARGAGDYAAADAIRARLLAVGIELADGPDGETTYRLPD